MYNVIKNLIDKFNYQFAADGRTLIKIVYFGKNPFNDIQSKTFNNGKTAGENISGYDPAKFISIKSTDSNTSSFGKVMASNDSNVIYVNTNSQINDPKHFYKINLPTRDSLRFDDTTSKII